MTISVLRKIIMLVLLKLSEKIIHAQKYLYLFYFLLSGSYSERKKFSPGGGGHILLLTL